MSNVQSQDLTANVLGAPSIVPKVALELCLPWVHPCASCGGPSTSCRARGVKGSETAIRPLWHRACTHLVAGTYPVEDAVQTRPILVVDDDPRACELIHAILTRAGYKVLSAPDGLSGIETARKAQPAAIVLDLMMPGIDGIHTSRRLKQDPVLRQIPVISITASPDLQYTEQAFRAGAACFVTKPFEAASLVHMVTLVVQRAQHEMGRRCHPRFRAELPAQCLVPGAGETVREVAGRTENVSLEGLLLWLPEMLAPGTAFHLQLGLPERVVTVRGTVVWQVGEAGDPIIPHGVRLLGFVDDADLREYRRFLEQVAVERAALSTPR